MLISICGNYHNICASHGAGDLWPLQRGIGARALGPEPAGPGDQQPQPEALAQPLPRWQHRLSPGGCLRLLRGGAAAAAGQDPGIDLGREYAMARGMVGGEG